MFRNLGINRWFVRVYGLYYIIETTFYVTYIEVEFKIQEGIPVLINLVVKEADSQMILFLSEILFSFIL